MRSRYFEDGKQVGELTTCPACVACMRFRARRLDPLSVHYEADKMNSKFVGASFTPGKRQRPLARRRREA